MLIPKQMIENTVADKYDLRRYLRDVYLNIEKRQLVATNGAAMAILENVEIEDGDTSGLIPTESLAAARKAGADSIKCNGSVALPDGRTFPRTDEQFPDYQSIINRLPEGVDETITIDASLLFNLATAMYPKARKGQCLPVTMYITGKDSAIRIKTSNPDATGVLMPRIKE